MPAADPAADPGAALGVQVLSVRSAVLSVLLGSYPEALPARVLVAAGRHFGLGESAVRVALTRGVAAGDLERTDDGYRTGARLLSRRDEQAEALAAEERPWDGTWESAVVVSAARTPADRVALRARLTRARLAELREGVWLRPANLHRPATYADQPELRCFSSQHPDPADLAAELWDLEAWAATGRSLIERVEATEHDRPVDRLTAAAMLVRHLSHDPLLPADLLPPAWPGQALRATYAAYQGELRDLVRSL